jgi:hypothetical protein
MGGAQQYHRGGQQAREVLDRSQEASLHAAKAETETLNVFGFYRQAFGDSQASSAMKATQSANEASRRVTSALQLLERARQSTREFVAAIAPV